MYKDVDGYIRENYNTVRGEAQCSMLYGAHNLQTVILLHGGGLSWWNYRDVTQLLSDRFYVVLPILDLLHKFPIRISLAISHFNIATEQRFNILREMDKYKAK